MEIIDELPAEAIEFLDVLAIEKNYSPNTILSYKQNLKQFFKWLVCNKLQTDVTCLEPITIRYFISFLKQKIVNISIKQKLATLKSFFEFLEEFYEINELPRIPKNIKKESMPIETISIQEIHLLLDAVLKRKKNLIDIMSNKKRNTIRLQKQVNNCRRDHAILALLAGTGIRVGELVGINIGDINLGTKTIIIHGKRNKVREVFFDVPLIENPLIQYLNWRTAIVSDTEKLFMNSKNNQGITTRSIQRMIKIYLEISNISNDVTPHTLRHSYATISIEKGANIKAISQLLGHAQVSTTLEYYTHLSKEHLRSVYRETHPGCQSDKSLTEIINNRKDILTSL